MNAKPGTPRIRKRELVALLDTNTYYWETIRERPGKWFATARSNLRGRPVRSSATNERQAMENLCKRLGVL